MPWPGQRNRVFSQGAPTAPNYNGQPWWKVPSQYWDYNSLEGGTTVRDWMQTLSPGAGHSYADYQKWLMGLVQQGLVEWDGTGMPRPTNAYWQQFHDTSFIYNYDANGNMVSARRDPNYRPAPPAPEPRTAVEQAYDARQQQQQSALPQHAPTRPYPSTGVGTINKPASTLGGY